jgi:hypothetical protein
MSRRLAAVIVALVALGAIAALLRLRDGDSGGDSLARMSADGEPIAMDVPSTLGFFGKPTGEAILIAERQGVRFLRLPDEDGTSCWATSDRSSGFWSIRSFSCDTEYPFPDPQQPVIVLASVRGDGDLLTYNELRGFAADGVKRIGALDAAGRVAAAHRRGRQRLHRPASLPDSRNRRARRGWRDRVAERRDT